MKTDYGFHGGPSLACHEALHGPKKKKNQSEMQGRGRMDTLAMSQASGGRDRISYAVMP